MVDTNKKPKIVYILGTGHSGSTLLDLILSTASNTFSVGGFRYIDRFIAGSHGITHDDAGYTAYESPMWREITKNSDKYIVDKSEEPVLSFRNRLSILCTGTPSRIPKRYRNQELYLDVQKNAEKVLNQPITTIIDSSKTLGRLIEIRETTDFDVFVIHLIRDVRGVANSNRKRNMHILISAKYWLTDNLYARAYLRKHVAPEKQMRIHYEDLVAKPVKYIKTINKATGLNIEIDTLAEKINNQHSYRFAGNGMRNNQFFGIQKDVKWQTDLPVFYRIVLAPLQLIFK